MTTVLRGSPDEKFPAAVLAKQDGEHIGLLSVPEGCNSLLFREPPCIFRIGWL
jgi:hypothetical protein